MELQGNNSQQRSESDQRGSMPPTQAPPRPAEPPTADPGDRLPATLEGWQAQFPDLGAWAFDQVQKDVLSGRAPTDGLTPQERSEVGAGAGSGVSILGYEPLPEDPDGGALAILTAAGPSRRLLRRQGRAERP